ncbi:hypothetical protein [Brevundimonas sp.]|uniref:hypothetical protein n=1 Tax=Brevundimonas sp. TaxID=1871086 RepID=UPI001D7C8CB1|nr:hypothetical protein [Brevundimonas sp.]MBL0946959.1 hypothetical protein [Brevundimonas sp.]
MRKITTLLTAAALATGLAACDTRSGGDTETSVVAEAMPETPDISETARDEQIVREGVPPSEVTGQTPPPEPIPAE